MTNVANNNDFVVERTTFEGKERFKTHLLSGMGCAKLRIKVVDNVPTVQLIDLPYTRPENGVPPAVPVASAPAATDFWTVPENAIVTHAIFKVHTAFAGGTSLEVGTGNDPDGFFTEVLANIDAVGDIVIGAGSLIDAVIGTDADDDRVIKVTDTGTFTAGEGTLTVVWVDPS